MVRDDLGDFGDARLRRAGARLLEAMSEQPTMCVQALAKDRNKAVAFGRFLDPHGSPHLAWEKNEKKESGKESLVYKKNRAVRSGVQILIAANRYCQVAVTLNSAPRHAPNQQVITLQLGTRSRDRHTFWGCDRYAIMWAAILSSGVAGGLDFAVG